ncbi:gamma-glutamyl-gamma-aminobutyrate hydrolase family protein [Amycolatopsis sp. NPDC059657]|uniref:gamma-glutamyl-gamma-aminobutyrate hydrolase family protein n=1 Tax=Amycolatopsis sp. NPDC059657 TaxID=3346899 RepID=UPI0036719795
MRPLIALPARFAASASALRFRAEVVARSLAEAVFEAGGEPVMLHPHAPRGVADSIEIAERLARCDALLLPGGGDIAPYRYGAAVTHDAVYDVDAEQDAFDLALAAHALNVGLPTLAICRGMQVVNVVLGGTLRQDIRGHKHVVHLAAVKAGTLLEATVGSDSIRVSCFHHQCLDRLGDGLVAGARTCDGTIESVERPDGPGWFLGVQWHPEDTAQFDPASKALFRALVAAAAIKPAVSRVG